MHASLFWVCLLATCSATAGAAERRSAIPAQFHGEWNIVKKDCGSARNDSVLHIKAREIRHVESQGKVLAVVTRGKRELAAIVESSGEGETWLDTQQFRLSANGRELSDLRSEPAVVRYRCP